MSEPANTPNNLAIEQRFKTNNLRTQISLYKTKYAKYGCVNDGTRIHIIWIGTNDLIIDTGAGYSHGYRLIPKYAPSYLPPYMVPITKPTNSGSTWLNVAFPPSLGFNSISQQNLTKAIEELSTCGSVYVLGLYDFSFSRAARGCPPPSTSSCSSSSPNFGVQSYITAVNDRVIKNAVESVKSMGRNVVYIDVYHDVVGGQVEPVEYQLNINSTTADSAIFDGIHLSDDRQRVIARRVCRALGVASSYCASL
jgi:lysophospholipase L1-like esterase